MFFRERVWSRVSMMVMCTFIIIVIVEYDGRRPAWLPNAPLDIEHEKIGQ